MNCSGVEQMRRSWKLELGVPTGVEQLGEWLGGRVERKSTRDRRKDLEGARTMMGTRGQKGLHQRCSYR